MLFVLSVVLLPTIYKQLLVLAKNRSNMERDNYIFAGILENMTDGVITIDLSGRILTFNPAASAILSIEQEKALNHTFGELFLLDEENDDFTQTVLDAIYESSISHNRIVPYISKGKQSMLSLTTSFLRAKGDAGRKIGIIAVFDDITDLLALQASEDRLTGELKAKHRELLLLEEISNKNRVLENERALARKVQENILPRRISIDGFESAAYYRPSNEIGGDFFDAFDTGAHIHFLIGDISGHSTSSALIMAVCKGMFLSLGQSMNNPLDIVTAANRMLCKTLSESEMFLTLVHAVYEKQSGMINLVSAGHNRVYLLSGEHRAAIDSSGPVLGWDPGDTWETLRFSLEKETILFLFTDGLVEARNKEGEEFENRLEDRLAQPHGAPEELVRSVLDDLAVFSGNQLEDDLTLFAIKRS